MIAAPSALRPKHTPSDGPRPCAAPRRRQARAQTRRPADCRPTAFDRRINTPTAPAPCVSVGHAAPALTSLAAALAGEVLAERMMPTSPPARLRDVDVRAIQASGTSNVDLETWLDDPATGMSMASAEADPALVRLPHSVEWDVGSGGIDPISTAALFPQLDGPAATFAGSIEALGWLAATPALFAVPDLA